MIIQLMRGAMSDVRMKEAAVPVMKTFEEPRTAQTAGGLLAGNALWLV